MGRRIVGGAGGCAVALLEREGDMLVGDRLPGYAVEVDAGRGDRRELVGRLALDGNIESDLGIARRIELVIAGGELGVGALHAVVVHVRPSG